MSDSHHKPVGTILLSFVSLLLALPALAQEPTGFDEVAAANELNEIAAGIEAEDVDAAYLAAARTQIPKIEQLAVECAESAAAARTRLEERYEPFREMDPEVVSPDTMDQRQEISTALDEAVALQTRCTGIVDQSKQLISRITEIQTRLSQQFLSSRTHSVVALIKGLPERAKTWPERLRRSLTLDLKEGISPAELLWMLVIAGVIAVGAGLAIRYRFDRWYAAAGGDDAPAQLKYLFPKPIAEFAPLWLAGLALLAVLGFALADFSSQYLFVRIAYAMLVFGIACVFINWATGPLSPSANISGLIPDHVHPLRLRLRALILAICLSFVVLGEDWLEVRVADHYVGGRASMIFLVGLALLSAFTYLNKIPGLQGRYRPVRLLTLAAILLCIAAVLAGYQNLAAYLARGLAATGLALFLLWTLMWIVYVSFEYLINEETPTAMQLRASLGITETSSRTGIGFMQLFADLILWIAFGVLMLYIWDDAGTTLTRLRDLIVIGETIGGVRIVPQYIIGGILMFAAVIVIIGWMKRWIDRRWLQHIAMDRGARDAIITLFGYAGFIVAIIIALIAAEFDLTGLAWVGGALALGVGFGMQEIANNFVSGLILLFERPIRAGDFVTVGGNSGVEGYVRSIRIRATEIETLDNQNVLVPNSQLVSGQVTNWVLRDAHGRVIVHVGVAYGSDVEKVRDILEGVARDHPEVITDGRAPAPKAFFMGFGDSSLNFELRVRVNRIERRFAVMSDLNFEIDRSFREAGIVIPFPQRDLHIKSYPDASAAQHAAAAEDAPIDTIPAEQGTRTHGTKLLTASSAEEIWAAITNIDALKRWLVREGTFEPHVGGAVSLALLDDATMEGRIDVFMPPRRLRIIHAPAEGEGPLDTGPITTELRIRDAGGVSRLSVTVSGIPDSEDWEEAYRLSVDRWDTALAELKDSVLRR